MAEASSNPFQGKFAIVTGAGRGALHSVQYRMLINTWIVDERIFIIPATLHTHATDPNRTYV